LGGWPRKASHESGSGAGLPRERGKALLIPVGDLSGCREPPGCKGHASDGLGGWWGGGQYGDWSQGSVVGKVERGQSGLVATSREVT